MTITLTVAPMSPLRQRLIEDMNMRRFCHATQRNYIRDVGRFATFLGRPPDKASAEDLRRFQVEQREAGVPAPTMNSFVGRCGFSSRTRSTGPTSRASCSASRTRASCPSCSCPRLGPWPTKPTHPR